MEAPASEVDGSAPSWPEVRETFRQWEWLRLWYNGVLVVWTLAVFTVFAAGSSPVPGSVYLSFAILCVEGALVSNLCFFAGPCVEAYAGWLGWRPPWLRATLFWAGTLFTAAGAALTVEWIMTPIFVRP